MEQVKQKLQEDIHKLQQTKEELEYILENHRAVCRLQTSSPPDIKPIIKPDLQPEEQFTEMDCKPVIQPNLRDMENHNARPNRPNSLPVASFDNNNRPNSLPIFTEPKIRTRPNFLPFKTLETSSSFNNMKSTPSEIAGVPITTPSNGIPFNFDSLMEGGTGLTPVSTPLIPSCSSQQRSNSIPVDLTSPDASHPPKLVSLWRQENYQQQPFKFESSNDDLLEWFKKKKDNFHLVLESKTWGLELLFTSVNFFFLWKWS